MKILVNTPDYKHPSSGGVASYYYGMQGYWSEDVRYNIIGRRHGVSGALWLLWDILKFLCKLMMMHPDSVLLNPSLQSNALRRDFLFLRLAHALGFPVVVLIHGFDLEYAKSVRREWVSNHLNKAVLVMVLANQFREMLKSWGVVAPIELITTKVEDRMLDGFDIRTRTGEVKNILFLSRMEKAKGVYETLDTFALLKKRHPELTLTMVGDGAELERLINYTADHGIPDVEFTGALNGEERLKAYRDANFFFFSSYGEGMPTVVLEAMAFGLPVMTRYVGGLCDFFEDGKMGRITDSLSPQDFAEMMEPFLNDVELTRKISLYNHQYASEHFMATQVGKRIELLIRNNVKDKH